MSNYWESFILSKMSVNPGSSGNLDENGGNDPPSFQNDKNDENDENDENDKNDESDENDENKRRERRERQERRFVFFVADRRKLLFPLK